MLLTVAIPSLLAADYALVTDVSQLQDGKKVIITNADATYGLGEQKTNNRTAVALTKNGNLITVDGTTNAAVTVLTLGQLDDGKYTFFDEGKGYLYAASSEKNYLKTQTTLDANGKCTIVIANGVATIKFKGSNKKNWLRYNSSSKLFSCYSSGQNDVAIYQYVPAAVADPVITVADGPYFVGDEVNVTLSCDDTDATIHYTTDGTEPTAETTTTGTSGTSIVLNPAAAGSVTHYQGNCSEEWKNKLCG